MLQDRTGERKLAKVKITKCKSCLGNYLMVDS